MSLSISTKEFDVFSQSSASGASLETEGREIVERLGGQWQRWGGLCLCPSHEDRNPSLSVRPGQRRLLFHCFAGCKNDAILRAIGNLELWRATRVRAPTDARSSPADPGRRNREAAASLWTASRSIANSPADLYLHKRRLLLKSPVLRYHRATPYGAGAQAVFLPAMLAAVRDESGLVAVHRTFLNPREGRLANLAVPKRALGRLGRGAVRLAPARNGVLGWAEGIENALAATQLTAIPCWATLGTERFAHVALPPGVERLILFLDNDRGGRRAEQLAREAHRESGIAIDARYPEAEGADWNDVLLATAGHSLTG